MNVTNNSSFEGDINTGRDGDLEPKMNERHPASEIDILASQFCDGLMKRPCRLSGIRRSARPNPATSRSKQGSVKLVSNYQGITIPDGPEGYQNVSSRYTL